MLKNTTLIALIISLAFLISGCGGKYPHSTPEELGKSIFEAIKNADKDGIRELQPVKDDVLATIKDAEGPADKIEEAIQEIEKNWAETEKEMEEKLLYFFDNLEDKKKDGLNLEEAEFDMVEIGKPRVREGLRMTDIKVHFKAGDLRYRIDVRRAAELKTGWVMSPDGFRMREEK